MPRTLPDPDAGPGLSAGPGRGVRSALVVASSQYQDPGLPPMQAPAEDAVALAGVLQDPAIGGFTAEVAVDRPVHELRRTIERYLRGRVADETALLYLSCHGLRAEDGQLYLATTDTERALPASTGIASSWLWDLMEACRARRRIVILDCCHSGAFLRGAKGEAAAEAAMVAELAESQGRGFVLLMSSRSAEPSFEGRPVSDRITGSVFTAGLVDGLRTGVADVDGDGLISVQDAFDHAREFVRRSGAAQRPLCSMLKLEGPIWLARCSAVRLPDRTDVPVTVAPAAQAVEEQDAAPAGPDREHPYVQERQILLVPRERLLRRAVEALTYSPDGRLLAAAVGGGQLLVWEVGSQTEVGRYSVANGVVARGIGFTADGRWLVAGYAEGLVRAWSMDGAGHRDYVLREGRVLGLAVEPGSDRVAALVRRTTPTYGLALWSPDHPDDAELHGLPQVAETLTWEAGRGTLLHGWGSEVIRFRPVSGESGVVRTGLPWSVLSLAEQPGGALVALGCTRGGLILVDRLDVRADTRLAHVRGEERRLLPGEVPTGDEWEPGNTCVAFSPDGNWLAAASESALTLWDVRARRLAGSEPASFRGGPTALAFSPDGSALATGSRNGRIRLWGPPWTPQEQWRHETLP